MTRFKWGVVAFACLLMMSSAVGSVLRAVQGTAPVAGPAGGLPVIILDPGHGGADGGAVGVDGVIEKDINLDIALILRDLLVLNGFEVVMTREEDISIHDPGVKGIRKQKTSDLHNRLDLVKQYPNALFISIHQNKFGDSRSNGAQVFYSPNNPASERLAELLQKNMVEMLQPENKRKCKKGEKNLYLIYEAKCPAILVECGFLSNPGDAAKLTDETYQAQLAFVTLRTVAEHLGLQSPDGLSAQ